MTTPCACSLVRFHNGKSIASSAIIRTDRLILRRWRPEDRQPFAAMNADPRVMKHFPATLSRTESDALVDRIEAGFDANGFGFWAVEVIGVSEFVGFIGLSIPRYEAHFTPAVEIGWRIAAGHWNKGFATEGARASLRFAFDSLRLDEVVSLAVPANRPSRRVMEKIGMTHDPEDDFDHPELPKGHPLRRHVLYRIASDGRLQGR